jgi:hypothetical protein
VKRIVAEHRAKTRDHGNRIWRLLNLETWLRVCIEGDMPGHDSFVSSAVTSLSGSSSTPSRR